MATFTSQSFNGRYITLTVTESDLDPINNRSKVNWSVSVSGANGVWYSSTVYLAINGTELVNTPWIDPPQGSFPMVNGTSSSGSLWVTHGSDGAKTVSVTFNTAIYYRAAEAHGGTFGLTTLDRTAPTVTATLGTIGVNSIAISASSGTVNCNSWDYRLGNGSWTNFSTTNGTSASKTITGLSTNTQYSITVRAKKTSNDVYGQSNTLTATTLGYADISSASNITLGSACNIKWSPYDTTHKFRVTFKVGNASVVVPSSSSFLTSTSSGVTVSNGVWTYTGTSPAIATFAPAITDSSTASMTIILETFTSNGTSIGTSERTVTATVPNNSTTKPTVSITLAQGSTTSGFTDTAGATLCVKSLSNLKVTYNASGKYSAKIRNINVTIDGQQYAATANATSVNTYLETGILANSGTRTVSATVTDSRGFTSTTATANIFVADYFNPSGSVTATISGQSVNTVATWSIAPVKDSQNKPVNTGSVAITRKKVSSGATASYTVKSISASTSSSTTAESNYSGSGTWSAATQALTDANLETYEYTLKITDKRGNNYAVTYVASTGVTVISRLGGGKGVTLFGEAQREGFWVVENGVYKYQGAGSIEYIKGTQGSSTNIWTGVTKDLALYDGKMIMYVLPYAGTSSGAKLRLTLAGGGTTADIPIYRYGSTTAITTHYAAGSRILLIYDADNQRWNSSAWYYSDSNNKVAITAINPASETAYYPLMYTATSGTVGVNAHANDINRIRQGTTSQEGWMIHQLGNNKTYDTDGNSKGYVRLYGSGTGYGQITYTNSTANTTHVLPANEGMAGTILEVVEEGTWNNGKYIKYSNGMAECYGWISKTTAIGSSYGSGGIHYTTASVTFPSIFTASPSTNITLQRNGGLIWPSIYSLSATSVSFYIGSATAESSAVIYIHVQAKGAWK